MEQRDFLVAVGGEAVDCHHARATVNAGHVFDVFQKVGYAVFERLVVALGEVFGLAARALERAERGYHHYRRGREPRNTALDVEKFLRAEVGSEACLRDRIVGVGECHASRLNAVAAVRDVCERSAVNERRHALERLHEVGLYRVL